MRHSLLKAAAVAVLLCVVARGWAESVGEHRLGFDGRQERTSDTHVSRVAETAGQPTAVTARAKWQFMRIAIFSDDVSDSGRYCTSPGQTRPDFLGGNITCGPDDILTGAKKQTLLEMLVPTAVRMHQKRLSVLRERGNIVVNSSVRHVSVCSQFSIPASHMTTGVADADFVLYVAAGPTSGNTVAWASTCQYFANGRPSIGAANVSPKYILSDVRTVRILTHEILHALGFHIRNFRARGMVGAVPSLRGKSNVPVLKSPLVLAQARAHFGCRTQTFLELEDMGEGGTRYSHWKSRSMKDDLMAGTTEAGIYSAITIAAMEDMGYYKGNYAMAEPMVYGQNAGCSLVTGKCIVDGVSQIPEMFCASPDILYTCTSSRLALGRCQMSNQTSPLPPQFQYFSDATLGGNDPLMDYCPYVRAFVKAKCTHDGNTLKGSVFGVMSRCLDAPAGIAVGGQSYGQHGICAEVKCATTTYAIKVNGARTFAACTPGSTVSLPTLSTTFTGGHITCPPYDSVCGMRVSAPQYDRYTAILAR
ncbi:major surface protease gp63 [Novymonas esmeraldas]|uniref:Leishmanolysin-like peptidase n=1 Tax=Novymonas esmeraldas TaxID=1808958 RepID=A0AAW0F437_9TRYP